MRRPTRQLAVLAVLATVLAGCGAGADPALRTTLNSLHVTTSPVPPPPPPKPCLPGPDLTASLRPPAQLPAPGAMPPGSFMAAIKHRGYLIAGVNAGFLGFAYLNTSTGQIEGFEIGLVRALAQAIFGNSNPKHVELEAPTVPQRIPFVQEGKVDIVVDAVTITCGRREEVDFSTVYYDAHQRVLVPVSSKAQGLQDLGHQRVCATAQSTDFSVIQKYPSHPIAVGTPQAIDCLVYLQEGRVAAISTDDSILEGFEKQDPDTKLVGAPLADVPYGMAISKAHPDFVRFVNGVLAQMRADGAWRALYHGWLGTFAPTPNPPPALYSG